MYDMYVRSLILYDRTRRTGNQRGREAYAAGRGAVVDTQRLQARVVHSPPIPFPLPVRGDTPFGGQPGAIERKRVVVVFSCLPSNLPGLTFSLVLQLRPVRDSEKQASPRITYR